MYANPFPRRLSRGGALVALARHIKFIYTFCYGLLCTYATTASTTTNIRIKGAENEREAGKDRDKGKRTGKCKRSDEKAREKVKDGQPTGRRRKRVWPRARLIHNVHTHTQFHPISNGKSVIYVRVRWIKINRFSPPIRLLPDCLHNLVVVVMRLPLPLLARRGAFSLATAAASNFSHWLLQWLIARPNDEQRLYTTQLLCVPAK